MAGGVPDSAGQTKSKTRNPETRRERRKNRRKNLRKFGDWCRGFDTVDKIAIKIEPATQPLNSSDFSSGFFLRSLRVSGFLVLLLPLILFREVPRFAIEWPIVLHPTEKAFHFWRSLRKSPTVCPSSTGCAGSPACSCLNGIATIPGFCLPRAAPPFITGRN